MTINSDRLLIEADLRERVPSSDRRFAHSARARSCVIKKRLRGSAMFGATPRHAVVVVLGLTALASPFQNPVPSLAQQSIPGGVWVSPQPGTPASVAYVDRRPGSLGSWVRLEARAYTNEARGGAGVNHVNFTATAAGTDSEQWVILCTVTNPVRNSGYTDLYVCHLDAGPFPSSSITVSFDVYDRAGNVNYAPNGTRSITRVLDLSQALQLPMVGHVEVIGFLPNEDEGDHRGRDLYAVDLSSDDRSVHPVAPGRVVFMGHNCDRVAGQSACYGNVIAIDHGSGIYSIYAHLDEFNLWPGWPAARYFTPIGIMSDSGCEDCGAHLHFAVRRGTPGLTGAAALFVGADTSASVNVWELIPELPRPPARQSLGCVLSCGVGTF